MTRNRIAALLLVISAILFIFVILFIEKVSDFGLTVGVIAFVTTATLFFYLYYEHRLSKAKRWMLLLFIFLPSLVIFLRSFLKA